MKLVGCKKVVKSDAKTKETYVYYYLFYTEEINDYSNKDSVVTSEGIGAGYVCIGESKFPKELSIGDNFDVLYNRFGKVAGIVVNENSN